MVRWDDAQSASEVFRGRAGAPAPPTHGAAPAAPAHAEQHHPEQHHPAAEPPGPWTPPEQRSPPPLRELMEPHRARGPPRGTVWEEPDEHGAGPWAAPAPPALPNMPEEVRSALGGSLPSRALPALAGAGPPPAACGNGAHGSLPAAPWPPAGPGAWPASRASAPAGPPWPGERCGAELCGDASDLRRVLRQDVREAVRDEVSRMLQEIHGGYVAERLTRTPRTGCLPRTGSGESCELVPSPASPAAYAGVPGARSAARRALSPSAKSVTSATEAASGEYSTSMTTRQLSMDVRRELVENIDTDSPHDDYDGDESNQVLRAFSKQVPSRMGKVKKCIAFFDWLWRLKEPKRRGPLARFLSKFFNNLATIVIIINALYMVHSTNTEAENPGRQPTSAEKAIEVVFVLFYCLELSLKFAVHRLYYFWNNDVVWNLLDLFLVAYGLLEISLQGGAQLSWLRALRLFKMAKVLRVLKVIRSLRELRLILACLTGSIISLFWSIVMIIFILFMFSLFFVQQTIFYFEGSNVDETMGGLLIDNFGSVQVSMLSLWASLTGGNDWWFYYEALESTGPLAPALFVFFIAFAQIALLNILTGIFVESAMKLAEPDAQARALELQQERFRQESDLRVICHELDADKTGTISLREFKNSLRSTKLTNYLDYLGIDMDQTKHLFYLLSEATHDQTVDIEKFVQGIIRMKGSANNISMQRLTFEVLLSRRILQAALSGAPPTRTTTPHCARETMS